MAYRIKKKARPAKELRRIALEQVTNGLQELDDADLPVAEKVHQVRKRCKKVRGLVRLFRPQHPKIYRRESDWFRDTARQVAELRDAKVLQDTYDVVMESFDEQLKRAAFATIRRRLTMDRKNLKREEVDVAASLANVTERFQVAQRRIEQWQLDVEGFDSLGGYGKTYARARKALRQARCKGTPAAYHEFRKRVKYHWYHTRILQNVWSEMLKPRREQLSQLADQLGLDHDLAVLAETIAEAPEEFGDPRDTEIFLAALQARRGQLEKESQRLGRRLFAEKADCHSDRISRYWDAWDE